MAERGDDILSLAEAADITPWSESSLYRIAQEGDEDSPFRKRRGRWAVVRSDLVAWVRAGNVPQKRTPAADPMPKPRRDGRRRGSVLSAVHQLREEHA
jgi:hypothetical protein